MSLISKLTRSIVEAPENALRGIADAFEGLRGCPRCGESNDRDAKFCVRCGKRLS